MLVQEWLGKDNKLGGDIWENKYRYKKETLDEWFDRVSGGNEELKQLIKERKFLFGGRTLANRGTGKKGSFSNCYSRGFVNDNLDDLMQAAKDIAITFKAQGGQGISLSKLRPKGCGINNGQFESDGIIPFMEIYNRTTESISQGGSRKGALIMTLDAWHKEADEFIKIKSEEGRIQKANLSLEIDDEFMECVKKYYETGEKITKHIVRDYCGNTIEYDVTPIDLYKLMMEKAYDWAEPGCIYSNRFRNYNMMEFCDDYQIETCNPCGEQPLPKHGACNLGSINLSEFVINPFTEKSYFDYSNFEKAVGISVEALDTVLDENMENHALEEQKNMAFNYRNIGLGVMGMHDCLIKLGIRYGSDDSLKFIDEVMNRMFRSAVIKSSELAKEKGRFPMYDDKLLESKIIKEHFTEDDIKFYDLDLHGLRNCSLLSIAPSGSIGTMLNISTGCEPLFQISYKRKTESLQGEEAYYDVYANIANEYFKISGSDMLPDYFNTSSNIPWRERVNMQAVLQRHVDTAISSTINLPNECTLEEIELLYLYSWEQGLKGITIFRDGCKRASILSTNTSSNDTKDETEETREEVINEFPRGYVIDVSEDLVGYKRKLMTGCGGIHFEVYADEATVEFQETFINVGSGGGCERNYQFISRLMSLALRAGVPVEAIIDQAQSIRPCVAYTNRTRSVGDTSKGTSCPSAIGHALKELQDKLKDMYTSDCEDDCSECMKNTSKTEVKKVTAKKIDVSKPKVNIAKCPECGEPLAAEGGCFSCKVCGYTRCD